MTNKKKASPKKEVETSNITSNELTIKNKLLKNRTLFLGGEVNDEIANSLVSEMIILSSEDPDSDITLLINSPGGSVTAGMAIYDTMQLIENDIRTISLGLAASMGQLLLTAGTPGKRFATPHARIMMHQPLGGIGGTASDIRIQAQQMNYTKNLLAEIISKHSKRDLNEIIADSDRDRWFSAFEAKDYGLIDEVLEDKINIKVVS
jgi:ATP-dependent Clp protease protease subunit